VPKRVPVAVTSTSFTEKKPVWPVDRHERRQQDDRHRHAGERHESTDQNGEASGKLDERRRPCKHVRRRNADRVQDDGERVGPA